MLKEVIRYLILCKKEGGFYKKTTDNDWKELTEYGLQVLENLKGDYICILDLDMKEIILSNWKKFFQPKWFKLSENSIIISMCSNVYYKEKRKKIIEINQLHGYEYHIKTEEIIVFKRENWYYQEDLYKVISLSNFNIYGINKGVELGILENLNILHGIVYDKRMSFIYYIIKNGEITGKSYSFLLPLVREEGYQINLNKETNTWGLYYIKRENIELLETYESCELIEGCYCKPYPKIYMVEEEGTTKLVEVNQKEVNIET